MQSRLDKRPGEWKDKPNQAGSTLVVLPELAPGTLREKVFGRGPRLEPTHPAARYRGAFSDLSAAATVQPTRLAPAGA